MKDFKLVDSDLDLSTGDIQFVNGYDAVLQRLKIRLQTFLAEWFFDKSVGVPYFQSILVKNPDIAEIGNIFRAEINDCPGIVGLNSFEVDYDPDLRTMAINFRAVVNSAEGERSESDVRAVLGFDKGESLMLFTYTTPIY
jgi:hypothetical protein